MNEEHAVMLKAAGLSENAVSKVHLLGLPPGTIISIISKFGPIALQILEEILANLGSTTPTT